MERLHSGKISLRDTPELCGLRARLRLWGAVCRRMGIGYQSMSTHEKARIGRGGLFDGLPIPDWLADIDEGVSKLPPYHKLYVVEHYTKQGTHVEHIARLRQNHMIVVSVASYYRRLNLATSYLNSLLQNENEIVVLRAS